MAVVMRNIVEQAPRRRAPDNEPMTSLRPLFAALLGLSAAACSPTLDWREFMAEGSGVVASFPCRPDRHARRVQLAAASRQMEMLVCEAGGATFALAFVDMVDPASVGVTLAELRGIALRNVQGGAPTLAPMQVSGMTPNEASVRMAAAGRLPDGAPVRTHAAFFTRGLRVYQATVIGTEPSLATVQTFFDALKFPAL